MKKNKAFSLVEVLVVIAIIALLAAIAIPSMVRARREAHTSAAKASLKLIANSLENYAAIHSVYPNQTTSLMGSNPPYLTIDYFSEPYQGYIFNATLSDYAYQVTASPLNAQMGMNTLTLTTGGVINP